MILKVLYTCGYIPYIIKVTVLQTHFFKNIPEPKWTEWDWQHAQTEPDCAQDRLADKVSKPVSLHFFQNYRLRTIATLVYRYYLSLNVLKPNLWVIINFLQLQLKSNKSWLVCWQFQARNTANTVQWVLSKTVSGFYCVLTLKIATFLKLFNHYILFLPFCREAKQGKAKLNNLLCVNKQIIERNKNLIFISELKPAEIFPSNLVDTVLSLRNWPVLNVRKHLPLVSEHPNHLEHKKSSL